MNLLGFGDGGLSDGLFLHHNILSKANSNRLRAFAAGSHMHITHIVFSCSFFNHVQTNCYSLHSIGPVIEAQGGAARFLAVYFGSAITGFFLSYSFTRAPAVGASGAVFGLVGSSAVFLLRHKDLLTGAQQSLSNLSRMIVINLVLGLATSKIDNWGHLGGLVGGAAIAWLVGPSFSYRRVSGERKMVLVDRPPVSYLLPQTWKDGL